MTRVIHLTEDEYLSLLRLLRGLSFTDISYDELLDAVEQDKPLSSRKAPLASSDPGDEHDPSDPKDPGWWDRQLASWDEREKLR